jgi:signal transduction histidine kinase
MSDRRKRLIRLWTVGGVLFGALFPAAAWMLAGGGLSLSEIAAAHDTQSVMWIVDLAPLVLGITGRLIGKEHANVDAALRATDEKVKQRTAELSEANERLEGLMRSKDQFVATVSHEVRNPLTVVLGFADELRDTLWTTGDSENAELAELIGDQSREINNIIEDLLVAARSEVGKMTIVPAMVDLAVEARTVVRGCVCAKDVRDAIHLDVEPAFVSADPSRVRQIIRNLLTNAIRYGGEELSVVVRSEDGHATVCVCDNGKGIPPEQREDVFQAYEQGTTDTPVSGSVGLGLNVSRKLARMMGGDLTYRYEAGISTFALTLAAGDSRQRSDPLPVDAAPV